MANIKSSKKRAKTNEISRLNNLARRSDVKTACKKVEAAVLSKKSNEAVSLLKSAESKIARAKGKKLFKANTASRKVSRLAKKVAALVKAEKA